MAQRVGDQFHALIRVEMVSCNIVTGHTRTPLAGAYLSSSTLNRLPGLEESLHQFKSLDHIVLGDFNVDLDDSWSLWSHRVVDILT